MGRSFIVIFFGLSMCLQLYLKPTDVSWRTPILLTTLACYWVISDYLKLRKQRNTLTNEAAE